MFNFVGPTILDLDVAPGSPGSHQTKTSSPLRASGSFKFAGVERERRRVRCESFGRSHSVGRVAAIDAFRHRLRNGVATADSRAEDSGACVRKC